MSICCSSRHLRTAWLAWLLGLFACLSTGVQASMHRVGPPPIPVTTSSAEIDAALNSAKNNLFFLESYFSSGQVDVEFDDFLLPNGAYTKLTCTWNKLVSAKGANILRKPTAKELEHDKLFDNSLAMYCVDTKDDPAYATGKVQMQIPVRFAHVTFAANEAKTSRTDGPLNVTMQSCSGNTVSLHVQGKLDKDDIIIFPRDDAGILLSLDESSMWSWGESLNINYKAKGAIASVEVFVPAEYETRTLDVLASAEPDFPIDAESINVKVPRYVPGGTSVAEAAFDIATLQAQTSVVARRTYAMMGYNTPEVVIKLPHALNSAYAEIDFGEPKLIDANGKAVPHSPEEGIFDLDSFSDEMRFEGAKTFAYADGTVHVRYPTKLRLVTLTPDKPIEGAVEARFHGGLVRVNVPETSASFLPEHLDGIRAFDASGRQLKKLNYNGFVFVNGVNWQGYAFWGNVTKLQVVVVDEWLTLDLPFHLPPAAELPKDRMGIRPADDN